MALLLLRLSLAALAMLGAAGEISAVPEWLVTGLLAVAGVLIVGLFTPLAASLAAACAAAAFFKVNGVLGAVVALNGSCAVALALIGPGGYSIDARLFGRRVIDVDR